MAVNYPTSLDTLTNPTATDYLNSPSHAGQHSTANDILEALEAKVGIDSSAVTTSHDYKLSLVTGTAKALPDSYLDTDGTLAANSDVKIATQKAVKTYSDNDWKKYSSVVPTRASADDPTYVLTFAGVDLTSILNVGKKIKWTQNGTVRYGIITAISFSTNTTLTLYGGTDYDVLDTATYAISEFHYSSYRTPIGFPLDPSKWTVEFSDTALRSQASPVGGTYYNIGTSTLSIPIGLWNVEYNVGIQMNATVAGSIELQSALSTANNSGSDADLIALSSIYSSGAGGAGSLHYKRKILSLVSKTSYYLNGMIVTTVAGTLYFRGERSKTFIRAICAYL